MCRMMIALTYKHMFRLYIVQFETLNTLFYTQDLRFRRETK